VFATIFNGVEITFSICDVKYYITDIRDMQQRTAMDEKPAANA
jgi:hypothetical protein